MHVRCSGEIHPHPVSFDLDADGQNRSVVHVLHRIETIVGQLTDHLTRKQCGTILQPAHRIDHRRGTRRLRQITQSDGPTMIRCDRRLHIGQVVRQ